MESTVSAPIAVGTVLVSSHVTHTPSLSGALPADLAVITLAGVVALAWRCNAAAPHHLMARARSR